MGLWPYVSSQNLEIINLDFLTNITDISLLEIGRKCLKMSVLSLEGCERIYCCCWFACIFWSSKVIKSTCYVRFTCIFYHMDMFQMVIGVCSLKLSTQLGQPSVCSAYFLCCNIFGPTLHSYGSLILGCKIYELVLASFCHGPGMLFGQWGCCSFHFIWCF